MLKQNKRPGSNKNVALQNCKEDLTIENVSMYFISLKYCERKTKCIHITRQLKTYLSK